MQKATRVDFLTGKFCILDTDGDVPPKLGGSLKLEVR